MDVAVHMLRRLRQVAELSVSDVTRQANIEPARLVDIESGILREGDTTLDVLLSLYKANKRTCDELKILYNITAILVHPGDEYDHRPIEDPQVAADRELERLQDRWWVERFLPKKSSLPRSASREMTLGELDNLSEQNNPQTDVNYCDTNEIGPLGPRPATGDSPARPSAPPVEGGPLVFLCHSSGDKDQVRLLYDRLREDGVRCWFDEEDLLPGQDWGYEIGRAIKRSKFVLACVSKASITKSGYVQKELKVALDVADEQPMGSTFLIPVRLEECEIPDRLNQWQWVDLFVDGGYQRLLRVLKTI
jgi:hypothetical protein